MKKQMKRQKKKDKKKEKKKAKEETKKAAVTPQTSVEEDKNARRMVPMTKEEWEKQQVSRLLQTLFWYSLMN